MYKYIEQTTGNQTLMVVPKLQLP